MTLTELRYIVAVAREGNFGKAARACYISQPTLSVAVHKLEEELGVVLFERTRTAARLTDTGSRIVEQAQRILEEAEALKNIAGQEADPLGGSLHIGAIHTIGPYLFPKLVPILHNQMPNMSIFIEEDYTAGLRTNLKQGKLDAIIVALPFNEPGVEYKKLYDEEFVAVLPIDHSLAAKKCVQVSDFNDETVLLLGEGHCFRDQVLEFCPACHTSGQSGERLQKTVEGSSLETIRHMVAGGIGVTILPIDATGQGWNEHEKLAVRYFSDAHPRREVALAWRKSFPRMQAIDSLHEAITSCRQAQVNGS